MYAFAHPISANTYQSTNTDRQRNVTNPSGKQNNAHSETVAQLQRLADNSLQVERTAQLQAMANNTGLPDQLKSGIEQLSGIGMDDVKVRYNSDKPAQLQAHAYAQGNEIHIASGQEKHLPHEAWHVVQQKQGRVKPTMQLKGKVAVNDDAGLEHEADVMGARAMNTAITTDVQKIPGKQAQQTHQPVAQAYFIQHNVKISDNHMYRIDQAATHQLQVAPHAPGPNPAHLFHVVGNTPDGYTIYELNVAPAFENDCLGFAEFLKTGKYDKKPAFRAKGDRLKGKDRLFGHSDAQNLDIAAEARVSGKKRKSDFSHGSDAHPGIGEAYAIVRGEEEVDECPYHIAQVVAQDVDDNITCEADAGDAARAVPVFDMYTTVKKKKKKAKGSSAVKAKGKTFHDTYESSYLTASNIPPVTGILV
ncbi:MAG: hypothetical protein A3D31_02170 [Candidatus Fluviicola riflensis]|nr:MAG: hypothetical protein CHH17_12865 [Candidatus Fluviicola riflensis]OGS78801.1 MAG: hypothetical protein A3D31_02170 [Candidatus Fluviicola riflensis]OGS85823.1 MAG: hypothetical protein A3E30_09655 [Fluviicola sp. RIFCSPHIGHO2_12_FULL_43_24]OGS86232.1 MAG: hypothetical protein A2724_01625 [Fluviicola sp. RIFCSPHIGHO2_01_FULL_43_53]